MSLNEDLTEYEIYIILLNYINDKDNNKNKLK